MKGIVCPKCKAKIVAQWVEKGQVVAIICTKCGKTTEIKDVKE